MTHRSKKPFECRFDGCDKSYCDARSLRRHMENHHLAPGGAGVGGGGDADPQAEGYPRTNGGSGDYFNFDPQYRCVKRCTE